MITCLNCWREHTGKDDICARCKHPGRIQETDLRHQNDAQRAAHLDMADYMAKSRDEGWYYDDDDEEN